MAAKRNDYVSRKRLWTEWVAHDGTECPLPDGTVVQEQVERHPDVDRTRFRQYATRTDITGEGNIRWDWGHWGDETEKGLLSRVVRYRIARYRAGSDLIARYATAREDA